MKLHSNKYQTHKLKVSGVLLLFLLTFFMLSGCNKDDNNCQGVECLPPATQTGAGTFGCLVNGVPYVDKSGSFNCFYQLVDGEFYFGISAEFNKVIKGIGLGAQQIELLQGNTYHLIEIGEGNFSADIFIDSHRNFATSLMNPGTIIITKFDIQNNIISATFEFSITDPNTGKVYEITEGRFDTFFTQ
jgi:hypothetical protein